MRCDSVERMEQPARRKRKRGYCRCGWCREWTDPDELDGVNGGGEGYCAECYTRIMKLMKADPAIQSAEALLRREGVVGH